MSNNLNLEGIAFDDDAECYLTNTPSTSTQYLTIPKQEVLDDGLTTNVSTLSNILDSLTETSEQLNERWPEGKDINVVIAMNEAYTQLVSDMIAKVEAAIDANKQKQRELTAKHTRMRQVMAAKRVIPVQIFLPPYFKDEYQMCAPLSDEARRKLAETEYDPLAREEKKWTPSEVNRLRAFVRRALLDKYTAPLVAKRDEYIHKVRFADATTSKEQLVEWRAEWEKVSRRIEFLNEMTLDELLAQVDINEIDWAKMANIDFGGQRTPFSLQLKWFNEVSPRWSQEPWSKKEIDDLKHLIATEKLLSWPVIAEKLGTNRTPWQCFEKYKSEIWQCNREWSPEEDEKLITLCNIMTLNGQIQWDKVTYYMPGRTRQQVRVRYTRSLNKDIKHGRWSDQEDLLLMCAVNRNGAKNWVHIAKSVPGRTDVQCRERWTSVLDRRFIAREWTIEDDEKLIYLVNVFGRSSWAKVAKFMPMRTGDQTRSRYLSLMSTKIRLSENHTVQLGQTLKSEIRNTMKKMALSRLYRKYETMISNVDDTPDGITGDKLLDVVAEKEQENNRKNKFAKEHLAEEELTMIEEELTSISERHKAGIPVDMDNLLSNIHITEEDVKIYCKRQSRMREQKRAKAVSTGDFTRKGRKVQLKKALEENKEVSNFHQELMESDKTEEEKILGLTEVLMDCVTRMDAHEFQNDFHKYWRDSGATIAKDLFSDILNSKIDEDAEKLKNGEPLGFQSTMPVQWANTDFYCQIQKKMPEFVKRAQQLFPPSELSIYNPEFFNKDAPLHPPNKHLFIRLNKEITESEAYRKTKVALRNLLIEPMIYEAATLSASEFAEEAELERDIIQRDKEEQDIRDGIRPLPDRNTGTIVNPKKTIRKIKRAKLQ